MNWLGKIFGAKRKVVVLGIDGLPYSLASMLAARGKPAFRRLFTEGMAVPGTSSVPFVSCTAWACAASGRNPGKHGIFGFLDLRPGSYEPYVPLATDVKCSRIWNVACAAGKKVAILGVPVTYPPEKLNGVFVSGFLAPSLAKAVHPPEYLWQLEAAGYELDVDPRKGHENKADLLKQIEKNIPRRADAIVRCMRLEEPDLLFAHVIETDRLNHFLFDVIESGEGDLAGRAMAVYDLVDDLLGRIINALPPGAKLVVCSDHGFSRVVKVVQINDLLSRLGWTAYEGDTPTHADIRAGSVAFSLDPGRIYVHTSARFPKGRIAESDRDKVAADIAGQLAETLVHPDTGEKVFQSIISRREAFNGPRTDLAPDLVIVPKPGYDLKGALPGKGSTSPGALVGMHNYDDALLAVLGCKITADKSTVTDVGPSVLHLLGLDPEPDTDGRIILA